MLLLPSFSSSFRAVTQVPHYLIALFPCVGVDSTVSKSPISNPYCPLLTYSIDQRFLLFLPLVRESIPFTNPYPSKAQVLRF